MNRKKTDLKRIDGGLRPDKPGRTVMQGGLNNTCGQAEHLREWVKQQQAPRTVSER